jgi:hypothetical protein
MTAVVTLTVWRVRRRDVAAAVAHVARWRRRPATADWARLLGTAGARFTPRDAQPTRWAMLTAGGDDSARQQLDEPARDWFARHAIESGSLVLRPVWSRGSWDGERPFGDGEIGEPPTGAVVALTRATLRLRTAPQFYRAVPPIAADLGVAPGLRCSFGIGERPLLRQGTVSIWDDMASLRTFAHHTTAHARAVRDTARIGWYAEEMFTRFALVSAAGSVDGRRLDTDRVAA